MQTGLNKGEAHHALKDAIHFHRKGELRDRSHEEKELRIAAMNILAAVIIFYNSRRLDAIVTAMAAEGVAPPPELLAHVSPFGWEHIVLTDEYTCGRRHGSHEPQGRILSGPTRTHAHLTPRSQRESRNSMKLREQAQLHALLSCAGQSRMSLEIDQPPTRRLTPFETTSPVRHSRSAPRAPAPFGGGRHEP